MKLNQNIIKQFIILPLNFSCREYLTEKYKKLMKKIKPKEKENDDDDDDSLNEESCYDGCCEDEDDFNESIFNVDFFNECFNESLKLKKKLSAKRRKEISLSKRIYYKKEELKFKYQNSKISDFSIERQMRSETEKGCIAGKKNDEIMATLTKFACNLQTCKPSCKFPSPIKIKNTNVNHSFVDTIVIKDKKLLEHSEKDIDRNESDASLDDSQEMKLKNDLNSQNVRKKNKKKKKNNRKKKKV